MRRKALLVLITLSLLTLASCSNKEKTKEKPVKNIPPQTVATKEMKNTENNEENKTDEKQKTDALVKNIEDKYKNATPTQWGEKENGIISKIDTNEKIVALTFDACGGGKGNGYDERLISYLMKENIPATLFINARWIDVNPDKFKALSQNPLFEIENHGYSHKPLSVTGRSVYGIKGTNDVDEVIHEVYFNEQKIQQLTGRKPKYFRSGTAYYDDVAVNIAKDLGEKPVNFDIIGDAGATFSTEQIKEACLKAKNGSIIICHMNHPEKSTADGIMTVVPLLKEKGFKFVKLEDYDSYLK